MKEQYHQSSTKRRGLFNLNIGFLPLPIFVFLCILVIGLIITHQVKPDLPIMIAIIGLGGAACSELGTRIPFLGKIGGAAIVSAFLPSYLVSLHWIPMDVVTSVTTFTKGSNFIYLFVSSVVVGSIFTMNRDLIIKGFAKLFIPLFIGSILALLVGSLVGILFGFSIKQTVFYVIVPIMGGGLGEGAIPLSAGYGEILDVDPGTILARLLPIILLGNLIAIISAGVLDLIGKRYPHLTGNGKLQLQELNNNTNIQLIGENEEKFTIKYEINAVIAAGMSAISLYVTGIILHSLFDVPGPVCMLFMAVLLKLFRLIPKQLEHGASLLFGFFTRCVTYPLLVANSIAVTHWKELISAFHIGNILIISATVLVLVLTGFIVARKVGLYPVEAGIVNSCHSGLGGTGDVVILTAANRMSLLPYAQISTRIGGAITVMISLMILKIIGY